jgi:hypothetical protein
MAYVKTRYVLFLVTVPFYVIYIATPPPPRTPIGLKLTKKTRNGSTLLFSPYKPAAAWETEIQSLGNLIIADVSRDDTVNYPCFHATGPGHVIPRVTGMCEACLLIACPVCSSTDTRECPEVSRKNPAERFV